MIAYNSQMLQVDFKIHEYLSPHNVQRQSLEAEVQFWDNLALGKSQFFDLSFKSKP